MSKYAKKEIEINQDLYLEIHYNPSLEYRPFYIRMYTWDGYTDCRFDKKDLLKLSEFISDFVFDNGGDTEYDCLTGLARLWHSRRNEVAKELEKYTND